MRGILRTIAPRFGLSPAGLSRPDAGPDVAAPERLDSIAVTLRAIDLPRVRATLARRLGDDVATDSPRRLENAVTMAITAAGGNGVVEVRRSPGAMRMPEVWTIRVRNADPAAVAAVVEVTR